jgi:hypothetical protein
MTKAMTAIVLGATLLAGGTARAASDPVLKCRRAVLRGAAKLADGRLAALAKCEQAKRKGKVPALTVCRDAPEVAGAFASARTKLAAAVDKACGGADKRCGGADDVTLAAMAWPGTCPDLEGSGCAAPLASCADVPACVACLADGAVTRGVDLVYAPFTFADQKTQKALVACQKALAAAATTLADVRLAVDAKCLDARLAGKHANACPLPGDGKGAAKLAGVRAKAEAKVCKACGGDDKQCGGAADLGLEQVGVAPGCPGVGACDTSIASIADTVACFDCTAAARADCALAAAAPGVADYPAGCAAVPATPTPTVTPTPTETPRATATLSASPTITPSPVFCPAADSGNATTTVTITVTSGANAIGGASVTLDYLPDLVRLPGVADEPAVRARVTDLTGGALVSKGLPNNQDTDGDLEPDRVRFSLLSLTDLSGDVVKVTFDRCSGGRPTVLADYQCTAVDGRGVDGVTKLPVTCGLAVATP